MYIIEIVKNDPIYSCFTTRNTRKEVTSLVNGWYCEDAHIKVRYVSARMLRKTLCRRPYVCFKDSLGQWVAYFVNRGEWLPVDLNRTPFRRLKKSNSKLPYCRLG